MLIASIYVSTETAAVSSTCNLSNPPANLIVIVSVMLWALVPCCLQCELDFDQVLLCTLSTLQAAGGSWMQTQRDSCPKSCAACNLEARPVVSSARQPELTALGRLEKLPQAL